MAELTLFYSDVQAHYDLSDDFFALFLARISSPSTLAWSRASTGRWHRHFGTLGHARRRHSRVQAAG